MALSLVPSRSKSVGIKSTSLFTIRCSIKYIKNAHIFKGGGRKRKSLHEIHVNFIEKKATFTILDWNTDRLSFTEV